MEKLRTLERRLLNAEKFLLIGLTLVIISLSFTQVLLRGLFSAGLLWADTFLRHLVLWVGFLGAAVAAGENKQFAMDAAARFFKGRTKAVVEVAAHGFTAAVCTVMLLASWAFFIDEWKRAKPLFTLGANFTVPVWYLEIILPAGFALLLIHYLLKLIISALETRRP